jgi:imidazolonepropionase-like amidohydrolase/Tol biopolymer transport system component
MKSVLAVCLCALGGLTVFVAAAAGQGSTPSPAASPSPSPSPSPWDVAQPPGPAREATVDTDEGTWMSVDVSPDGREVAFDLLGDIYVVPIGGGEARALTRGHAWDMQPRYSPDGKRIAFTSDRAGGDNIWVMERDGAKPTQVTKESFRLLNSPAWTPDGEFLAARKHFTSRRSLGAGEIWLYHRSGGDGLQVTKRPNDQKDLGEPAFSPDGRYLYYSQDATPGGVFEYNKNPHDEIYVVQRLDRDTGETDRYVTGPGGSARPVPSPDGRRLAFVRRVGVKTALFVKDLDSGRERPVFDALERDMQETWAIHGVYPAMAWTPDSRSLVFWAGGKIRRVDVETKAAAVIPFHVKATHRLAEALRFPVEAEPPRWPVRMLRWVQVSPAGDRVVYEALGRLWVRGLPEGTPRRLTTQEDHFELYPSWSRDGKQIVYVAWDDEELGSLRVASAGGGAGRVVTDQPGHYAEPVFSPDASRIVYRKGGGGFLTSPEWSGSPGIHVVPAGGGRSTLVTRRGRMPHFGAAGDRVYVLREEEEDKRSLVSIELDGSDERAHLLSETATEFQVSPDERWVAFREGFNAYIAPFARTGKRQDIGHAGKAIPVARVSKDAGEYLHWSGDGRALHWSLGPELFTRPLTEAFGFVSGAPDTLPDLPSAGRNIGFEARTAVPAGAMAVVGGRVVTMKGDEVIEDGVVLVEGNRITAVGPRGSVAVPAGAHVVDAAGQTVLPGIVDAHWHGSKGEDEVVPEHNWVDDAALAFGVTTIHDPSNDTSEIFAAAEMTRAGLISGPRTFSTGTILYGAAGDIKAEVDSLDDARAHLRRMKAVGAFSVKSYNQPRREQRQQIITAARELGMMVVPEGGSLFQHNMTMVLDGHTGIEHALPVPRVYGDVLQLWPRSGTGYTPTIIVGYGGLWGENYWYQHTRVWDHPTLRAFVPPFAFQPRARRRAVMAEEDDFNHLDVARTAKALSDAGVSVQLGAHGQREGLGAHWEIWMLVQGGMTPHQALRAATLSGARYLGLDRDLGSLEPGKLADLFVVEGNPLADIRTSDRVRWTAVGGRLYDARTMDAVWPRAKPRPKGFWEE